MDNCLNGLFFLTLIAGRKQKDALLDALTEAGGRLVNIVYGKGTVNSSHLKSIYLKSILGMTPDENKVIITCLLSGEKSDAVFEMLIKKFNFDQQNTGIAFTVPVEELSI
jgi:hypothetical protein